MGTYAQIGANISGAYMSRANMWGANQGCYNGRFWMKITVRTSARVRLYPADAVLPSADASARAWVRADPWLHGRGADAGPRGRANVRGHASPGHGSARTWGRVRVDKVKRLCGRAVMGGGRI
jgi:hypothetical protein